MLKQVESILQAFNIKIIIIFAADNLFLNYLISEIQFEVLKIKIRNI